MAILENAGAAAVEPGDAGPRPEWELEEAVIRLEAACRQDPFNVKALNDLGVTLSHLRRYDEALQVALRASMAELAAHNQYHPGPFAGAMHLMFGRLKEGFALYEYRAPAREIYDKAPIPRWDGERCPSPGARMIVVGEQGLGDVIQFARYIPRVAALGWSVAAHVNRSLAPLIATVEGCASVEQVTSFSPDDRYCPLLSLPFVLQTTLATIPAGVPYVGAVTSRIDKWRARMPERRPRVGIVWAGNPQNRSRRSMALDELQAIFDAPASFVSLQAVIPDQDRDLFASLDGVTRIGHLFDDFADTAAVIHHLDLVITVDTAVAHLAGAMGKPVWLMLIYAADWRWMTERSDSPWYPTMRLYRQRMRGGWDDVVARVHSDLHEFCASHQASSAP